MNTDYMVQDIGLREKQYRRNINSKGDTRYYDDSCKNIREYAREQNTVYNPMTNQILYGINSNMHVSGVSDGTCNQVNPNIFTSNYMCGAGAAGGNRCKKDAYGIENFETDDVDNNNFAISEIFLISFAFYQIMKHNNLNVKLFYLYILLVCLMLMNMNLTFNNWLYLIACLIVFIIIVCLFS